MGGGGLNFLGKAILLLGGSYSFLVTKAFEASTKIQQTKEDLIHTQSCKHLSMKIWSVWVHIWSPPDNTQGKGVV